MIEEFDRLAITTDNYDKLSKEEIKRRVAKQKGLLSKMNNDEIKILLERPYPGQYKHVLKQYLK